MNPILVPLDGSRLAERALGPAKDLARFNRAQLHVVSVARPEPVLAVTESGVRVHYPEQALSPAWQVTSQYLKAIQKSCAAEGVPVQVDVREGDVASEIAAAAEQIRAPLIVMSSHGYSGLTRWLIGSVAEQVLHAAPCPVWVVRTQARPRQMLVTLDGSELAETALVPALEVARCFGARVTLLRVVPELKAEEREGLESCEPGLGRRYMDETLTDASNYLAGIAERFKSLPVTLHTAVQSGPAAQSILDFVDRHGVDLVAMSTHGRTGLRRWLYGSVMRKVLDQLPVSMLVARSQVARLN